MKKIFLSILITGCAIASLANHITGGMMYYTYVGKTPTGENIYHFTLNLYRDHFSTGAPLDDNAAIAIFDNATKNTVFLQEIPRSKIVLLELKNFNPCITNPPQVFYEVGYYEFTDTLPESVSGYTVAYQRCCRIAGINNLTTSSNVGTTYSAIIPGTSSLASAPVNNSARFIGSDTVIICANNPFSYSFAAKDDDGDQLTYAFCDAYQGGGPTQGTGYNQSTPYPPAAPPYFSVPYGAGFTSSSPLGSKISINPNTGLITGTAPGVGIYCVTVCVTETRNGVVIAVQRKDLQIKIADCTLASAMLKPDYTSCDGFTNTFNNLSNSPLITSYSWDFGVSSANNDTSNLATPTYTYPDTGTYVLKLVTNRGQLCSDSSTAAVHVYPGFYPAFNLAGICISKPTLFTDATTSRYGSVNSWRWNFGDNTSGDTSIVQNPSYTYPSTGTRTISLIVGSNKGCLDTITHDITIIDKPPISLSPNDTLICVPDAVQLHAAGEGNFSWSPLSHITNPNSATPTVSPVATTWYYVTLDEQGCINTDSVQVRVVDHVSLKASPDSIICQTDSVQLFASGNGLKFQWTPSAYMNDATLANPFVTPPATTTFHVIATIGSCSASDNVTIRTAPYPKAKAGADTMICYNTSVQLHGSYVGTTFSWSPANSLSDAGSMDPVATPAATTTYVLHVYDTIGCPKPGFDTVIVTVLPKVIAFAGRDTSIVVGQPLQLNASGGLIYQWSPSYGLSSASIADPVAIYDAPNESIRYKVVVADEAGCVDSAFVAVKVFNTRPQVFVPTAFTPNNDGKNDLLRPIAVGISQIDYFRVFNRWGQLVFSTTTNGKGWDGTVNGQPQGTDTYVWIVHATDYAGKSFFAKGVVTLIR
jgi:gliding motility-associated-like protein